MNKEEDILYIDFEGWPVYRRTLREILEDLCSLGVVTKLQNTGIDKYVLYANDPILDTYPTVEHDDGMGYSPMSEYITNVNFNTKDKTIQIWSDVKEKDGTG